MKLRISKGLSPLTEYLESMIYCGQFIPGKRIPAMRTLAKQFGIPLTQAKRAVDVLAERGLLEMQHGSGVYVVEHVTRQTAGTRQLGVISYGSNLAYTYTAHTYAGVMDVLKDHPDWSVSPLSTRFELLKPKLLSDFAKNCDALLILGCFDSVIKNIPRCCPGVGVEIGNTYGGWLSTLSLDPYQAAQLSVDYFRQRKVRHVHIDVVSSVEDEIHRIRRRIFRAYWEEFGTCDVLANCFETNEPHTGWWFSGSGYCMDFEGMFRKRYGKPFVDGIRPILSVDGKAFYVEGYPLCSTLWTDWRELGRTAFNEVLRRVEFSGAPSHRIFQNVVLREPMTDKINEKIS